MKNLLVTSLMACTLSLGLVGIGHAGSASIKPVPNKKGNVRLVIPTVGGGSTVVCVNPSTLNESHSVLQERRPGLYLFVGRLRGLQGRHPPVDQERTGRADTLTGL